MRKIVLALLLMACAIGRAQTSQELLKNGTMAPDFTITNIDNGKKTFSLSDLRTKTHANGKVKQGMWTVLDFWASWCPDCRKDMPMVKKIYDKYKNRVKLIGVSFDTDREKMTKYLKANNFDWLQYSEFKKWKDTKISKEYHISWIPTSYLIDPDGKVAFTALKAEEMMQKLDSLDVDGKLK